MNEIFEIRTLKWELKRTHYETRIEGNCDSSTHSLLFILDDISGEVTFLTSLANGPPYNLADRILALNARRVEIEAIILNNDGQKAAILRDFISDLEDEEKFLERTLISLHENQ